MHARASLALLIAMVATTTPVFASCVTTPFHFLTRGDTVAASERLSSGDTCFHTLRNHPVAGNSFGQLAIAQRPSHGSLAIDGSAFQYRSSPGYRGSDSYAVKICMESPRGKGCSIVTFNADIN